LKASHVTIADGNGKAQVNMYCATTEPHQGQNMNQKLLENQVLVGMGFL
jgi:hypothetical protein